MSKILKLDPTVDLWITYSWSTNNHGICGHTFEVIEYYYILKSHFKVKILLAEDITWSVFEHAIRDKYAFTEEEILDIKNNTLFNNRPKLLTGRNILFVDGGVINTSSVILKFDNIIYFACGNKEVKFNNKKNVFILQDNRVYEPVTLNGINYKKKLLFDKFKPVGESEDNLLVYATKNCRAFNDYVNLKSFGKHVIAITNRENTPPAMEGFTFINPPVDRLFERFNTYLYTPVPRKWDCSPRFIAECHYYQKDVIYYNIDYWDVDKGLYWRHWDIHNDFGSLFLNESDEIITIMRFILC